jgi:16S rRNA (guanine527-N7)-methyltransferase
VHTDRIADLLKPFLSAAATNPSHCHSAPARSGGDEPAVLSPAQFQHISTYIDILLRWNARINLTAIRDPEQIVTRHFGESLFAARHIFPREDLALPGGRAALQGRVKNGKSVEALAPKGQAPDDQGEDQGEDQNQDHKDQNDDQRPKAHDRVADLGSGAGFPGIPIKLWVPQISLTLIESNHKKATFLREVVRTLTLTGVNIITARAETLPEASFDVLTLRAVEHFETILPVAARLIAPTGRLALLLGSTQLHQARTILPDLVWSDAKAIPESQSRILAMGRRVT